MSYAKNLQYHKRRPSTTHLTPAGLMAACQAFGVIKAGEEVSYQEALNRLNNYVDGQNKLVAQAISARDHWQQIAAELEAENAALRETVEELRGKVKTLEVESQRLRRRAEKRKRGGLEPDDYNDLER